MGKRGPKPKSAGLRLLDGTLVDRDASPAGPTQSKPKPKRALTPPPHLEGDALGEWYRIAPEIEETGAITPADASALAIYCVTFARWLRAQSEIEALGVVIVTDTGAVKANPACAVAARCESTMTRVLSSFGLDPASRSRVAPTGDPADSDPMAEFLRSQDA